MKQKEPQGITRYVYLFELDSVRKSDAEVEAGLAALTRELVRPDTCVVLTYNQIVDGRAILRCFADVEHHDQFVEMFRRGKLKINRLSRFRSLIAYVDNALRLNVENSDPRSGFIFSSLDFLNKPWYHDGSAEANRRLKALFSEMRDVFKGNDYSAFDDSRAGRFFESDADREIASNYVKTVLDISVSANVYIDPKPAGISKTLVELVQRASSLLREGYPGLGNVTGALDGALSGASSPNSRSSLYSWLSGNCADPALVKQSKRVVDLAYNFVCMDSIDAPGLSYDDGEFARKLAALVENGFENS